LESYGLRGDGIPRNTPLPVPTPVTPVAGITRIALANATVVVLAPMKVMPNVVGQLQATALGQLNALGLSVQVQSVPDPDRRCPHVGFVESQSPPPGSAVGPSTHVSIRVYTTAQGGCL
jgi:beta-lactam-binding protein with PASTA domain